jgi:GT2 family glycosyltransferase
LLNAARLRELAPPTEAMFGRRPQHPACSLVIPLYGRVDFVEYQMALFCRDRAMHEIEIIYVLDDPSKRRELDVLARSTFARFGVPFRLLFLETNLGFGPASNAGLKVAQGEFVCFMNSDVFPITDGWLPRLIQRLTNNPHIGILGPRLLFEDGAIQHEGCAYLTLSEFGGWHFVDHINKGRRPAGEESLRECDAITGACMLLKRSLARDLGGFDIAYVIGDFEDSDLCRKAAARGLSCAVDNEVHLYHLERKSQSTADHNWRMNLTLYNAWVHERRWFSQPDSATIFSSM